MLHRNSSIRSPGRCRKYLALLAALSAATFASSCSGGPAREERPIAPGVRLIHWTQDAGPEALYAVEEDLSEPLVRPGVSVGRGTPVGLEPISGQAARLTTAERYPVAGVNGDFFYYPDSKQGGISTNALVTGGEVIRSPYPRSCLVLDGNGRPSIRVLALKSRLTLPDGTALSIDSINHPRSAGQLVLLTQRYGASTHADSRGTEVFLRPERPLLTFGSELTAQVAGVQKSTGDGAIQKDGWVLSGSGASAAALGALKPGDVVHVRLDFEPAIGPTDQVIGGGPRLVRDGKISLEAEGGSVNGAFATARHPRTAVGFNDRKLILLVVDGRQPGYSAGMSLAELAQAMVDLGCTDAMNFDGGGSTTLWARGSVVNRPSDGRERPVADGLLLFSTAPHGEAVRLVPHPQRIDALAGADVPLSAAGEDRYFNPVAAPAGVLAWTSPPALGTVEAGHFRAASVVTPAAGLDYVEGSLTASAGSIRGELPVRVFSKPARVEIVPATARIGTATQVHFRVKAFDREGRPLALPPVRWNGSPGIGEIDSDGNLAAAASPAAGTVSVDVSGVTATVPVEVAVAASRAFEDFEQAGSWVPRVSPATTIGSVNVAAGIAHSGTHALRIQYDFSGGTGTRAVYALTSRNLGKPFALKAWVYGDGEGEWLRARLRDGKGATVTLDLARSIDWKDSWRELRAPISDDVPGPLTLEAIYVVEADASRKPKGAVLIDDLTVDQ